MTTMVKSLFQNWLNWEFRFDRTDTGVPHCGVLDRKDERSPDNSAEGCGEGHERRDSASPWVHGLL